MYKPLAGKIRLWGYEWIFEDDRCIGVDDAENPIDALALEELWWGEKTPSTEELLAGLYLMRRDRERIEAKWANDPD